jgi:predicted aspartyl protease
MALTKCGFDSVEGGASGSELLVLIGPTLFVDIGFDQNYKPGPSVKPLPGLTGLQALVDTGATESCIDNLVGHDLGLPVVDRRPIAGVHGRKPANIYLAQVHVPTLNFTIYGSFAGVDLAAGGQVHRALIGRTFLRRFTMVYEGGTGTVTLSSS